MNTPAAAFLVSSLLEMPAFMEQAFCDLRLDQLCAKPDNDKSPLFEHAWHVRDCEEDLYGMRIRKVLNENEPYLEPMSVSEWPRERGYLQKPVAQAVQEFRTLREGLVKLLRAAPLNSLNRTCRRGDASTSSIADLIVELLEHDQDHRVRIAAILARRVASIA